jgi:hypothetical protein
MTIIDCHQEYWSCLTDVRGVTTTMSVDGSVECELRWGLFGTISLDGPIVCKKNLTGGSQGIFDGIIWVFTWRINYNNEQILIRTAGSW